MGDCVGSEDPYATLATAKLCEWRKKKNTPTYLTDITSHYADPKNWLKIFSIPPRMAITELHHPGGTSPVRGFRGVGDVRTTHAMDLRVKNKGVYSSMSRGK